MMMHVRWYTKGFRTGIRVVAKFISLPLSGASSSIKGFTLRSASCSDSAQYGHGLSLCRDGHSQLAGIVQSSFVEVESSRAMSHVQMLSRRKFHTVGVWFSKRKLSVYALFGRMKNETKRSDSGILCKRL